MVSRAKSLPICEIAGKCQASTRAIELLIWLRRDFGSRAERHNCSSLEETPRGKMVFRICSLALTKAEEQTPETEKLLVPKG